MSHHTPPRYRVRNESDVLALVPYTLGFHPEQSLVVVSLDAGGRPFLARVDLPHDPDDVDVLVDQLVFPVRRSEGRRAFLVAYTADRSLAEAAVGALSDALEDAGVDVLLRMRAHRSRWFPLGAGSGEELPGEGRPYDLASHVLTSRGVLDGRVTFASRHELARSLDPVEWEALEEVAEAHAALGPLSRRRRDLRAEARTLVRRVREGVGAGTVPDPHEVARLLRGLAVVEVRDVVWCEVDRGTAAGHVRFWREVVRRSPQELVAPAAGLLAFSAWQAGNGALAWCAVERSLAADPDHSLARLVATALETAAPPDLWTRQKASDLPLFAG